jgi:hypothetical protein
MSIIMSSALTRADTRILGNNLGDAIQDQTVRRRRRYRRLLKTLNRYLLTTLRRKDEWHIAYSSIGGLARRP